MKKYNYNHHENVNDLEFLEMLYSKLINLEAHNYIPKKFEKGFIYLYLKFLKKYFNAIIELDITYKDSEIIEQLSRYYNLIFLNGKYIIKTIIMNNLYTNNYYKISNKKYCILNKITKKQHNALINNYKEDLERYRIYHESINNRLYTEKNHLISLLEKEEKEKNFFKNKIIIDKEEYRKLKKNKMKWN